MEEWLAALRPAPSWHSDPDPVPNPKWRTGEAEGVGGQDSGQSCCGSRGGGERGRGEVGTEEALQSHDHLYLPLPQAWGISVLNPNKTKPLGNCEDPHSRLLLSFPSGQLSLGFTQVQLLTAALRPSHGPSPPVPSGDMVVTPCH